MARDFDIQVRFPVGKIQALWQMSPEITAFHVRDAMGAIMGRHRRELLRPHKGTAFANLVSRSVHYRVFPKDVAGRVYDAERRRNVTTRIRGQVLAAGRARLGGITLRDIHFRIWSTSEVTLAFERGSTIAAGKAMTVPIGEYRKAIDALRAGPLKGRGRKAQHNELRDTWLPTDRVFKRGTTLFRKNEDGSVTPVATLKRSVTLPALLRFHATWNAQATQRAASLQKAVDRIVSDIAASLNLLRDVDIGLNVFRNRLGSGIQRTAA